MKISPILVEPGQNTLPPFAQQMGTIMVSFSDLSEANQVRLEFVDYLLLWLMDAAHTFEWRFKNVCQ